MFRFDDWSGLSQHFAGLELDCKLDDQGDQGLMPYISDTVPIHVKAIHATYS